MEDNFIIFHEDVLGYEFLLVWRNDNELVFCSRRKCIYRFLNHRLKRIIIIRYMIGRNVNILFLRAGKILVHFEKLI